MWEVTIYIETSTKAAKRRCGSYGYVLECQGQTRKGTGTIKDCTYYQLVLTAMTAALKRMTKPSKIKIITDCKYVIHGYDYIGTWAAGDWKKCSGEPLANAELWKELYELGKNHEISLVFEPCSKFSALIREEMKKNE